MSDTQESYVASSFLMIHSIITRALSVSIESAQTFSKGGFTGEASREGFFNYLQALAAVVNSHHLTEDEIAFPYFREKLPGAPFDTLIEEHQQIVHILDEIKLAVEKGRVAEQLGPELKNLESGLTRLNGLWHPHIEIETAEIITKADALIPVEERLRLVRLFGEFGQKHALPPYLTVPFMLYNLNVEDRMIFSQGMPAEVLQHLVPVVWKDQWVSMTPFFLS